MHGQKNIKKLSMIAVVVCKTLNILQIFKGRLMDTAVGPSTCVHRLPVPNNQPITLRRN